MKKSYFQGILLLPLLILLIGNRSIMGLAQQKDVEGSKDHSLISRYPGSLITHYSVKDFDEYELALGRGKGTRPPTVEKSQRLDGKVTLITYKQPPNRSTLEIFRNYEIALKEAGFETLFICHGQREGLGSCGTVNEFMHWKRPGGILYEPDQRYLAAKLSRPDGDVYIALHVGEMDTMLDIIEMKPMEAGLVKVDAVTLAQDLARTGHVAVYGIFFDFNKADVKPESEPTLKEIAKMLQQNPDLKVYVVSHTDSVGELKFNMDLSRRRADAVLNEFTTKYGIPAARLRADGVGPLAPVASNDTEEGRAKNRRVELVKQ